MPDVNADANTVQIADVAEEPRKLGRLQAGGILDEQEWTLVNFFQLLIQFPGGSDVLAPPGRHVRLVMNQQAMHLPRESFGEFHNAIAGLFLRQVEVTRKMHDDRGLFSRAKAQR